MFLGGSTTHIQVSSTWQVDIISLILNQCPLVPDEWTFKYFF